MGLGYRDCTVKVICGPGIFVIIWYILSAVALFNYGSEEKVKE